MKHNQSGRSMVEMLGVLTIVLLLSTAGTLGYRAAIRSHQANQAIEQIRLIDAVIRGLYAGGVQPNYAGLDTRMLLNTGTLPGSYDEQPASSYITGALGPIQVRGDAANYVISAEIPQYACLKVLSQNWESFSDAVTLVGHTSPKSRFSASEAAEACRGISVNGIISWGFGPSPQTLMQGG